MTDTRIVSITGGIVHKLDGYWVWWSIAGEEDQAPGESDDSAHGPHPTLESARGALKLVQKMLKEGYRDEGGVVVRENYTEAGKS